MEICAEGVGGKAGVLHPYGLARQEKAKHCKKKSQMYYFARTSSDIVKGRCIDVYKNPSRH